jgi:predicted dehydrogenase
MRLAFFDDQLDNFHANTFLDLIRGELKDRGHRVVGCHTLQAEKGRTWAAQKAVPWFDDAAALTREADAMLVLAPSTPATHPELCARVFPAGKPTYVDKTFATDYAAAQAIFALADRYRTPVQTSSALRYASIVAAGRAMQGPLTQVSAWGGGASFGEYAIHPLELVVALLGHEAERVLSRGAGDQRQLILDFSGGRSAVVNLCCNSDTPYVAALTTAQRTQIAQLDWPTLFPAATAGILDFLASGVPTVDRRESLVIRRILDLAEDPRSRAGFVAVTTP